MDQASKTFFSLLSFPYSVNGSLVSPLPCLTFPGFVNSLKDRSCPLRILSLSVFLSLLVVLGILFPQGSGRTVCPPSLFWPPPSFSPFAMLVDPLWGLPPPFFPLISRASPPVLPLPRIVDGCCSFPPLFPLLIALSGFPLPGMKIEKPNFPPPPLFPPLEPPMFFFSFL